MPWAHDQLVRRTIAEFVGRALPDAHDWEGSEYRVTAIRAGDGDVYEVEAGIPTSAHECWLFFEIREAAGGPIVGGLHGIRSGRGDDIASTYVCGEDGAWEPFEPDDAPPATTIRSASVLRLIDGELE